MGAAKTIYQILQAILFKSDNFHSTVDLGGNLFFKIWERPGKWCSDDEINQIIKDVHFIAKEGQQGKDIPEYGVLEGNKEDLRNRVLTIAYEKKSKRPIGFAAQVYFDIEIGDSEITVLHIGLVYVIPEYQKKSLTRILSILPSILLLLKNGFRPLWISNVSQVPVAIGIVGSNYQNVFPNPLKKTKQTLLHRSIGIEILKYHRKAFGTGEDAIYDPDKQIIYNSYTGGSENLKKTFEECPKYRNEVVNSYCKDNLNYERGDDVLQLGLLSQQVIQNFLKGKVADISFIHSILFFGATSIFIFILPVLRWLTRKKPI